MKYEHVLPKIKVIDREKLLLNLCRDKKVLHIGCADTGLLEERILTHKLLHSKLMNVTKKLWGIDLDLKSIATLRQLGVNNLLCADAERLNFVKELKEHTFDVILGGELIEHLNNPGLFLRSCIQLLRNDGILILTTPNAFRFINFLTIFFNKEIIHPDHNFWFSATSLKTILMKHGYAIRKIYIDSSKLRISLKKGMSFNQIITRKIYAWINNFVQKFITKIWPYFGNGLIFIVQKEKNGS
jgi:2-polyprenyl-3-methyl-5-hydroxy-6-metoxy-1,4-benzoquinol methylase